MNEIVESSSDDTDSSMIPESICELDGQVIGSMWLKCRIFLVGEWVSHLLAVVAHLVYEYLAVNFILMYRVVYVVVFVFDLILYFSRSNWLLLFPSLA